MSEFNTKEAAEYLKVSEMTIRRWDKSGFLVPANRFGPARHRRYTQAQLDAVKAGKGVK